MAFTRVSVLVPTRGRIESLQAMLASFWLTVGDSPLAELVFRLDEDDHQSYEALAGRGHRLVVGPRLEGYRSLPTFFNELAEAATGDVLMLGNDDMVFRSSRWDRAILEAANKYPDGIFNFGVTTYNHMNFPFSTVSKKVVNALGFLYDPRIFWGDIYLLGVMSAFGRAISLPEIVIDHDWMGAHPDATFTEGDAVRRSNWMTHHQTAIDEAVEKLSIDPAVRALRPGAQVEQRSGWTIVTTGAAV